MKLVHGCLSARVERESSFDHFGSTVRLVQDCLCAEQS